jgi:hypothetical protein
MLGHYLPSTSTTICYYPLGSNLNDLSGNSYNLTSGQVTLSATTGKFGGCAVYANNYNAQFSGTLPATTTSITISAWVYQTSASGSSTNYEYIWSQCLYTNGTSWTFRGLATNSGVLTWINNTYGTAYVTASTYTLSLNTWTHVAVTISGTTISFYVNGVFHDSQTAGGSFIFTPGIMNGGSVFGGVAPGDYNASWVGSMCELIVEPSVWTDIKIRKYYTFCKGRFGGI